MPGNPVQPCAIPPVTWRTDWSPRDYWVPEPKRIPPAPTFQKWIPQSDTIAFGESPRATESYQALQSQFPQAKAAPVPPKANPFTQPQWQSYQPWTLRDYSANQDRFSVLATPLLPPLMQAFPQWQAYASWALRDYAANQAWLPAIVAASVSQWIPQPDTIAFGEGPQDRTAQRLLIRALQYQSTVSTSVVPPAKNFVFGWQPRDMTALLLSLRVSAAQAGIPVVPSFEAFASFEYEPIDQTPYLLALRASTIPAPRVPFLFPTPPPYVEPPQWTFAQYQQLQDRFSALGTPVAPIYPKGLKPYFALEALIRDIPRPILDTAVRLLPPPPPHVPPVTVPYLEPPPYSLASYQPYQGTSAWIANMPAPAGFRVMAVTAGIYLNVYYLPGDVFDLLSANDYSDSRVNYQFNANEYAGGWMQKVPALTPLFQTIPNQPIPLFPVLDPNRRWGAM